MRDGVQLSTDLYLPNENASNLPCILIRSPAGRHARTAVEFIPFAKEGYVIAIQETRSAKDLEGKTFPYLSDGWGDIQDGYDTVEWLASSSYTNGKIGTWGVSAMGITQLFLAPTNPPHLYCQYVVFAASSLYHHGLYPGGQLLKNLAEGWLSYYAKDTGLHAIVSQRPFYNDFWSGLNSLERAEKIHVPGMHIGGWYDIFLEGTISSFITRQNEGGIGAKGTQKLVIGPWTHFWPMSKHFGDFPIPKEGTTPPHDISPKRWFDHYLKGIPNKIEDIPTVTYFVMGPFDGTPSKGNIWKTSSVWPIPSDPVSLYLSSDAHLGSKVPHHSEKLSYDYDPRDPIVTQGGSNLFLESGPKDQKNIESRKDILVFTTEKLEHDVEITGSIKAVLYFDSDQDDTDIVVRLTDVYPDGKSILISEGGYRLGVMCPQIGEKKPYRKGQIVEANIDLSSTSMVFAQGHAIRISVSSSNYPRFEKNMNVGLCGSYSGRLAVAHNTLHVGKEYPSHIVLPFVKT